MKSTKKNTLQNACTYNECMLPLDVFSAVCFWSNTKISTKYNPDQILNNNRIAYKIFIPNFVLTYEVHYIPNDCTLCTVEF